MNCSRLSSLEKLAQALVDGATMELHLTPKPGLVDQLDSGSHPDLSLPLMERSIGHVAAYLTSIVASLKAGETFAIQQAIALCAEKRLLAELGTNTHKGYLFLSGMLLIAQWHAPFPDERSLRQTLSARAEAFFRSEKSSATHGQRVRAKFKSGGIVQEAIDGYPSLFEAALPTYRAIREQGGDHETAAFAMFGRLMQTVDDTTTLHRSGPSGLARVRRDGRLLEQMIGQGEDFRPFLTGLNRTYTRLNLTIGGVADMLGIGYGYLIASGELSVEEEGRATFGKAA